MIVDIGVDILNLKKLKSIIDFGSKDFLKKVYTEKELKYAKNKTGIVNLATTFVAKEAIFKTLGSLGIDSVDWREIEILRRKNGKPFTRFKGKLKNQIIKQGSFKVFLSVSSTTDLAIAFAILAKSKDN